MTYVLALHGGAGTIQPGDPEEAAYRDALAAVVAVGEAVLCGGGSAVDAVVAAVVALEDCPLFNAGTGAVFNADAAHELDASVMDGATLAAGAVAGVRHVRNPVRLAHAVMRDGRCVLLAGAGAERFAWNAGFERVPNDSFSTERRLAQLQRVQSIDPLGTQLDHSTGSPETAIEPTLRFGTVGAVALDLHGHLAAATSTGGMTNKRPGRIGDSPIVGAGVYANDATCALSATGTGEHFLRASAGHDLHARMLYGRASLGEAAHAVMFHSVARLGGRGGLIALGRDGALAMPFNSAGMYRGWVRRGQPVRVDVFGRDPRRRLLGVLGGMGPLATADFLRKLIAATPADRDQDHVPVLVSCIPQIPDRVAAYRGTGRSPVSALVDSAERLVAAGAQMLVMPCNTAHLWFDELCRRIEVPMLHIVDAALCEALQTRQPVRRLGLLATAATLDSGLYPQRSRHLGADLDWIVPDRLMIEHLIEPGIALVKASKLDAGRRLLLRSAAELQAAGAQALVLGCTEIPLVLDARTTGATAIDPTGALARPAVAWATA